MTIFKAYDIRGRYPDELNEDIAEKIGFAIAKFISNISSLKSSKNGTATKPKANEGQCDNIVLGWDVRESAPSIAKAVTRGLNSAGFGVVEIGLVTTPLLYFAVGRFGYPGGVMVTASHNPSEWIGFKITREDAIPIGEVNGLKEIEDIVKTCKTIPAGKGKITSLSVIKTYRDYILGFIKEIPKRKIVVDTANGSVGPIFREIFKHYEKNFIYLCTEPDGKFPTHEPNPLKDKNILHISKEVIKSQSDLAICFDGDGDRVIFLDEQGNRIPCDLITVLLAREAISQHPASAIVYDLRSSKVVKEEISALGGIPIRERVGHAFIKNTMRKINAVLGGELSGHYYFKEHFFADSGLVAVAKILNYLANDTRKISEIISPLRRYFTSGEINFYIENKDAKIREVAEIFKDGKVDFVDGITVEFSDWWFNLRKSNTEPLLRLNMEADTQERFQYAKERLFRILGLPSRE